MSILQNFSIALKKNSQEMATQSTDYDDSFEELEENSLKDSTGTSFESIDYMAQLSNSLLMYYIIPDVLDYYASNVMLVQYPNRACVLIGNHLLPEEVVECPNISWEAETDCLYTLMMVDLDSPSSSDDALSPWLHWLVINLPGCTLDIRQGDLIAQYVGVSPAKGSGVHRYVFIAYTQAKRIRLTKSERFAITRGPNMRSKFLVRNFVDDNNLHYKAASCNFFLSQWTEFLPYFNEKLSIFYPETDLILQNINEDSQ